ncbi:MAG: Mur ligase domain-containing protein [Eubacterium ramulus]
MRQTEKLLQELNCRCIRGELPREVKQVAIRQQKCRTGRDLFVCIRGSRQDGHAFIREAVERGAVVILTEKGAWKEDNSSQEAANQQKYCVLETPDTRGCAGIYRPSMV